MLVLTRKPNESIRIGRDVIVNVVRIEAGRVKLSIVAPGQNITRTELLDGTEADDDTSQH